MQRTQYRLDRFTRHVATLGFSGLVVIAFLTMIDATGRWLNGPRIPGFGDIGELVYPIVIATCFPAGLLQGHNITIRFLGKAAGPRIQSWLELLGSTAVLIFFSLLVWQFVLLTMDLQANNRTTGTVQIPVAAWWWITTVIMAICIPVQGWVVANRAWSAITGQASVVPEQMTSEVAMNPDEA
ncbi:MAG: TRAP transporter small permease subunit [Rhodospirillales bacterium]